MDRVARATIQLSTADNTQTTVNTDSSWMAADSPILFDHIYDGEYHNMIASRFFFCFFPSIVWRKGLKKGGRLPKKMNLKNENLSYDDLQLFK